MAADNHSSTHTAQFPNHVHDGSSGKRVASLEWFIQNNEFRVVDQCMSDFGSLPHSFGILSDFFVCHIGKANEIEHTVCLDWSLLPCEPIQPGKGGDELVRCHPVVHFLMFGDKSYPCVRSGVFPRVSAKEANLALARFQFTHEQFEHGWFACSIWPEHTGNSAIQGECDVRQRKNAPIWFWYPLEQHCWCSWLRLPSLGLTLSILIEIRHHSRVTSIEDTLALNV